MRVYLRHKSFRVEHALQFRIVVIDVDYYHKYAKWVLILFPSHLFDVTLLNPIDTENQRSRLIVILFLSQRCEDIEQF